MTVVAPQETTRPSGPEPERRTVLALRLARQKAGQAEREALLARRQLALRPPVPRSVLQRQLRQSFDEDVDRLTARLADAVRASPSRP